MAARPVHKIFIGGGGDDWISHIVENYASRYARLNPEYQCRYYSWTDHGIGAFVRQLPSNAHVTLVGHSYGGDAACFALTTRRVDVLITIDPVSYLRNPWTFVRSMAGVWLNVRSEPSWKNTTTDDVIATIGHRYPRPPAPGQPGAPNYAIIADKTHGDFAGMMRLTQNGVSGASLLGGRRAG